MDLLPANAALYTGLSLCVAAGLRCAGTAVDWYRGRRTERQRLLATLAQFDAGLSPSSATRDAQVAAQPAWQGYRRFVVQRVVSEAEDTVSLYLTPEDRRVLPSFLPGQYLTLRVNVPGTTAPLVRCFSLSHRPNRDHYRITVKAVRPAAGQPFTSRGRVSRYLNTSCRVGTVIESKAPRGEFHLQRDDSRPAVLVGAGIGITPLLSMASEILHEHSTRKVVLFYGVRNSREHAFRESLHNLATAESRFHYLPCYSQPLANDRIGFDFVAPRRIDADLLQRVLPDHNFPFYVCGPATFMESVVEGLRAWGVAEADLHFEAFGPSTVKRSPAAVGEAKQIATSEVRFERSQQTATWDGTASSLLDLGEAQGLSLPSGCRSGNCGMCAVRVVAGQVRYPQTPTATTDPGFCLTCLAQPESESLVLDA
jgi:ferredoxin-NADP reductase